MLLIGVIFTRYVDGRKAVTISGRQFSVERQIVVEQIITHLVTQFELQELAAEAATGQLRIFVKHVYHFGQELEALRKMEASHAQKKICAGDVKG